MKETTRFPVTIRRGSAAVRIYRTPTNGYDLFTVCFYLGKRRVRKAFSDFAEAKREAELVCTRLTQGDLDVLTLRSDDRAAYIRAVQALSETKVPIELAAMQFAEAFKLLNGASLIEAVSFYAKRHKDQLPTKSVSEIVSELLAAKEGDGVSTVYLKDLKSRLTRFGAACNGLIKDLTAKDVQTFLRSLPLSGRSKNNYRRAIGTLIGYAKIERYLPSDFEEMDFVTESTETPSEIEIFTPKEMLVLLTNAGPDLVPFLAIGAFSGLRHAEITRLEWQDVNLTKGFIEVKARKSKTASRRLVPVQNNLKHWLLPYFQPSGPICLYANMTKRFLKLSAEIGIQWKHNVLRHSYISYRVAQIQNVAQVALEAGNSPNMIFRHYREVVQPDAAATWFSIEPQSKDHVLLLATG